ncbi:MAG: hypothetical protein ACHQ50_07220 [Fimbriimonadales bacterium]
MKFNNKFSALYIALALTFLGAQAQADIVVLSQHNFIQAFAHGRNLSDSSDSLASWKGSVTALGSARASLWSNIAADSLSLSSSTYAQAGSYSYTFATATTRLLFTVSVTRTYELDGTLDNGAASIRLLRDGILVLSGPFSGAFLFEIGHKYEIDAHVWTVGSRPGYPSGCGFSMR